MIFKFSVHVITKLYKRQIRLVVTQSREKMDRKEVIGRLNRL